MYNATPATPFVESPKDLIFKIVEHYFIKIVFCWCNSNPGVAVAGVAGVPEGCRFACSN
jgi:hypothetical protein